VKQEAIDQLAAANRALAKAAAMMTFPLYDEAGRQAYYAMFHAAHALVVERGFKPAKTHRGLWQLFARVAHAEPAPIQELVSSLTTNHQLKWVADYETAASTVSSS
jgi:uncharacterized protein (UPF0332 family)